MAVFLWLALTAVAVLLPAPASFDVVQFCNEIETIRKYSGTTFETTPEAFMTDADIAYKEICP